MLLGVIALEKMVRAIDTLHSLSVEHFKYQVRFLSIFTSYCAVGTQTLKHIARRWNDRGTHNGTTLMESKLTISIKISMYLSIGQIISLLEFSLWIHFHRHKIKYIHSFITVLFITAKILGQPHVNQ